MDFDGTIGNLTWADGQEITSTNMRIYGIPKTIVYGDIPPLATITTQTDTFWRSEFNEQLFPSGDDTFSYLELTILTQSASEIQIGYKEWFNWNGNIRLGEGARVFATSALTQVVPIPPAALLFGSALGLLGWMRRKAV